jgi:hypothetical protein
VAPHSARTCGLGRPRGARGSMTGTPQPSAAAGASALHWAAEFGFAELVAALLAVRRAAQGSAATRAVGPSRR